jgi:hypothetical protein
MVAGNFETKEQRQAAVLMYQAQHPRATNTEIARALGVSNQTVARDLQAAVRVVVDRAADTYRAMLLTSYFQLLEAHLPRAIGGDHKSAQVVIATNKDLATLLGLNATTKHAVSVEIRKLIEALPPVPGLSVEDAVAEAERILAGIGSE